MEKFLLLFKFYLLKFLATAGNRKEKKKYLFLIRIDHLGDFLITLPLFSQLKEYASRENRLLAIALAPALKELAEKTGYFDKIIIGDESSWKKRLLFYRECAKLHHPLVVNFHIFGRSLFNDYAALFPSPEKSFLFDTRKTIPKKFPYMELARKYINDRYTHLIPYDPELSLIENEARLASCVTGKKISPAIGDLSLFQLPPSRAARKPYYIIVPGANSPTRRYPAEKFAFLIDGIQKRFPFLTPVISGTEGEKPVAGKVLDLCQSSPQILDLTGRTTLRELFANIRDCEFLISNDTSAIHIAAKFQKRTFCFSGSWHGIGYAPPPELHRNFTRFALHCDSELCFFCTKKESGPYPCLADFSEKEALETILEILEKEPFAAGRC